MSIVLLYRLVSAHQKTPINHSTDVHPAETLGHSMINVKIRMSLQYSILPSFHPSNIPPFHLSNYSNIPTFQLFQYSNIPFFQN